MTIHLGLLCKQATLHLLLHIINTSRNTLYHELQSSENNYTSVCRRILDSVCRVRLKCDGTRAETMFGLSTKRTSPFKSAGASVQSTTASRGVRISGSNARYAVFRGSAKGSDYPLHSPVSPSLPLPCVTVCHQVSTGVYLNDTDAPNTASCAWEQTLYTGTSISTNGALAGNRIGYLPNTSSTLS